MVLASDDVSAHEMGQVVKMDLEASPFDASAEPGKELSTVEEEAEGQELSIWKSPMTTRARESSQGRRCAVESVLLGRRQGRMPALPLTAQALPAAGNFYNASLPRPSMQLSFHHRYGVLRAPSLLWCAGDHDARVTLPLLPLVALNCYLPPRIICFTLPPPFRIFHEYYSG